MPALTVQLDYTYDTSGFFADPARRAVLQQAADNIAVNIQTPLAAITPGSGNDWDAVFLDPSTGRQVTVHDTSLPADTIRIYVGARQLGGTATGTGGYGGWSASGPQAWLDLVQSRGTGGFGPWGGAVAFDGDTNWYFGTDAAGIGANEVDFLSVAQHELGHVLGVGSSPQWFSHVSGGTFTGANAELVYGGAVPLSADGGHWADGVTTGGTATALDPVLPAGTRVAFTSLDYAALQDVGWSVAGASMPTTPTTPTGPNTPEEPTADPVPIPSAGDDFRPGRRFAVPDTAGADDQLSVPGRRPFRHGPGDRGNFAAVFGGRPLPHR